MKQELFADIPVLQRESKPRKSGLTVIIDERLSTLFFFTLSLGFR